jgi:hypothetical protein
MKLPDQDLTRCSVCGWVNQTKRKVEVQDELYGDTTVMDHWDILRHGRDQSLPAEAVLLTRNDFAIYPQLDHTTWMSDLFANPTIDAHPKPFKQKKSGGEKR